MTKVFQTIIDQGNGNCMQAAIASLFDLPLEQVPHFPEHKNWKQVLMKFFEDRGYNCSFIKNQESTEAIWHREHRPPIDDLNLHVYGMIDKNNAMLTNQPTIQEIAQYDGGINGYFYAVVNSQSFKDCTHAVVCDSELNIVHDPNPNGKALNLKVSDILRIMVVKNFYIDLDGTFVNL